MHINQLKVKMSQMGKGRCCYTSLFSFQAVTIYYPQALKLRHSSFISTAILKYENTHNGDGHHSHDSRTKTKPGNYIRV